MNQVHVLSHRSVEGQLSLLGVFTSPSKVAVAITEHRIEEDTRDDAGWTMKVRTNPDDVNITLYDIYAPKEHESEESYASTICQLDELDQFQL